MANLVGVVKQLQKERERAQSQVERIDAALAVLRSLGGNTGKRTVSAAVRRKMSLAQKTRWAKQSANGQTTTAKPKRTMPAAARRKIAAFQRARWAKLKAEKKKAA